MRIRSCGVLLPILSLPSRFGIGDLGPVAYRFVDFLSSAGQSLWQVLPLNPTDPRHGNSPYHSESAFAFNPLFISPESLMKEGWLDPEDLQGHPSFPLEMVDYPAVVTYKVDLFRKAFRRFQETGPPCGFESFRSEHSWWLDDFALFMALKRRFNGVCWSGWPAPLRDRDPDALREAEGELREEVQWQRFLQYAFLLQWNSLRNHCSQMGVQIFGDITIYVTYDSVDVWAHPGLFKLDGQKRPIAVAGVPPDYFSEEGQLWGNPLYDWEALKEVGFKWWLQRIGHNMRLFDWIRIDHFRGLVAYWEVPASETTAVNGRWVEAPVTEFLTAVFRRFPSLALVAEDLGIITPEVREVMARFEVPGMKVLLFSFGQDMPTNPYIPHNLPLHCVAYPGTHDNNTVLGWLKEEATEDEKARLYRYLGRWVPDEELHWELIRLLMMSVARTIIIPMQDILGLGSEARMNRPSEMGQNWQWRLRTDSITRELAGRLREMALTYGRA